MPVPVAGSFTPLWSQKLGGAARGVALAREKGWILAWDEAWLYLFNHAGVRQGQIHLQGLRSAAAAEDGSSYAAVTQAGNLTLLAPDLTPRWQKTLPAPLLAVALDTLGHYVVAADQGGGVHLLDVRGRLIATLQSPRPLCHLAFVPGAAVVVASADYGLVGGFDPGGDWVWRDGLVAHVGGLAVNGDGSRLLLACFSEGLRRYDRDGKSLPALSVGEPCRLVAQSYDGGTIVVAGLNPQLLLMDGEGRLWASHRAAQPIMGLALSPRAELAVLASDANISCLTISRP